MHERGANGAKNAIFELVAEVKRNGAKPAKTWRSDETGSENCRRQEWKKSFAARERPLHAYPIQRASSIDAHRAKKKKKKIAPLNQSIDNGRRLSKIYIGWFAAGGRDGEEQVRDEKTVPCKFACTACGCVAHGTGSEALLVWVLGGTQLARAKCCRGRTWLHKEHTIVLSKQRNININLITAFASSFEVL